MGEQDGPRISKDGRFWWDGQKWQPVPQEDRGGRMPGQVLPTPVIFILVALVAVFATLFIGYELSVE